VLLVPEAPVPVPLELEPVVPDPEALDPGLVLDEPLATCALVNTNLSDPAALDPLVPVLDVPELVDVPDAGVPVALPLDAPAASALCRQPVTVTCWRSC
jgi:hypothetical protein